MTNSNNPISCSKPSLCPDSKSLIRDTWEDADAHSSYCVEIDKNRFIWFYQPRHHVALWSGCEMTWQFFLEFISHVPHCVSKRMWLRLLGFCVFLQSVRAILCVKANVVTIGLGFVGFYSQSVPYCVSKRMWLRLAWVLWVSTVSLCHIVCQSECGYNWLVFPGFSVCGHIVQYFIGS